MHCSCLASNGRCVGGPLFICQLSVGSLLRIVCTAVLGKMAGAQVFAFSLFLILTVHGSEVGKLSYMSLSVYCPGNHW